MKIILPFLLVLLCTCKVLKPPQRICVADTVYMPMEDSIPPRLMKLPPPDSDADGVPDYYRDELERVNVGSYYDGSGKRGEFQIREKVSVRKEEGTLVYDVPSTMYVATQYPIRVRINREISDTSIRENLKVSGTATVRTSGVMEVEMTDPSGKMFLIVKTSDRQVVEEEGYTEWLFTVEPLKAGYGSLNLVVSVIIDGNKKQKVYQVDVDVKTIPVVVVKGFFDRHWQWVMSTFFIPLGLWLYEKKKKR